MLQLLCDAMFRSVRAVTAQAVGAHAVAGEVRSTPVIVLIVSGLRGSVQLVDPSYCRVVAIGPVMVGAADE